MNLVYIVCQVFYSVEGSEDTPIRAFLSEEKAKAYMYKLTGEDPANIEVLQYYDDSLDDSIGYYYQTCILEGEE